MSNSKQQKRKALSVFRETDLVSFGNFLLSDKRESMLREKGVDDIEERRKHVHLADLENWKFQNTDK